MLEQQVEASVKKEGGGRSQGGHVVSRMSGGSSRGEQLVRRVSRCQQGAARGEPDHKGVQVASGGSHGSSRGGWAAGEEEAGQPWGWQKSAVSQLTNTNTPPPPTPYLTCRCAQLQAAQNPGPSDAPNICPSH